jgi:hypothetical protein
MLTFVNSIFEVIQGPPLGSPTLLRLHLVTNWPHGRLQRFRAWSAGVTGGVYRPDAPWAETKRKSLRTQLSLAKMKGNRMTKESNSLESSGFLQVLKNVRQARVGK